MRFNKQFTAALVAFAVLGLLVLALFALLPDTYRQDNLPVTLSDRAQNAFAAGIITNASGSYTVQEKNGVFNCETLDGLPTSQQAFETLAQQCTSLTAYGPVDQAHATPADYGFDTPTATANVTYSDAGGIHIEVGAAVAGTSQYYIRVDKSAAIYRIDKNEIRYLLADQSAYLDLSLTPSGTDSSTLPTAITLTQNDTTLSLKRLDAVAVDGVGLTYQYQLQNERGSYVDPDSYKTYFGELPQLKALGVVTMDPTELDLQEYGLSPKSKTPPTVLSFTMLGETITLRIGNRSGDFYYLYREGIPAIYRLDALAATWDGVTEYALMSRYLMAPLQSSLRGITITTADTSYQFDLTQSPPLFGGSTIMPSSMDAFYTLLCSLRAEYEMTEPAQNIPPDLSITLVYDELSPPPAAGGGTPEQDVQPPWRTDTIRFIPYGTKRYAIEINGTAQYAVRSAYVAKVLAVLATLPNGAPVSPIW